MAHKALPGIFMLLLAGIAGGTGTAVVGAAALLAPAGAEAQAESEREAAETEKEQERERESDRESDNESEIDGRDDEGARGDVGLDTEADVVLAIDLSAQSSARARALGFRITEEENLRSLGFRLTQLATPGGIAPLAAVKKLREADPGGVYDVNPAYVTSGDPPCAGIRCDGQKLIGWPATGCPAAVRIGIVDTAVALSSPALAGLQIEQRRFGDSADAPDHGTQIATILAGGTKAGFAGLLPQSRLLVADVFVSRNHEVSTDAVLVARGLDWLLSRQPLAINVAVAGPDNAVVHETVRRVVAGGVPIVAAAGNLGADGPPRYPAAYPEAIAVTAVDRDRQIYARANQGDYIDLAAPGVHVWTAGADGQGRFVDGTSFATPFVTAEVALMRLAQPQRAAAEFKLELRRRALPLGTAGQQRVFGAGLLQSRGCAAVPAAAP